MTKRTSSKSSPQQSGLNALAPLRIRGIAEALLQNRNDPDEVERLANELLTLEPDIFALLIDASERLPGEGIL